MKIILFLSLAAVSALAGVKTITVLDRAEQNEALVFHADHLWVGQSRKDFKADPKLLIFDRSDKKVAEVPLRHSPQYLYPYGAQSVLVVGTSIEPNLTMYTIATRKGESFSARTIVIPMQAWANRWLGTVDGKEYFTDPGGNSEDTSTDLSLAAQTIFRMDSFGPKYLSTRLRLPVGGMAIGNKLFVVQHEAIGAWQSNLAVIDPRTGQFSLAFPNYRKNLSGIAQIPGTALVAVTERDANQLLLLDKNTLQLSFELNTPAEPRGVTAFGQCALAGSFSERGVRVFRRTADQKYEVALDLAMDLSGNEFARLFQITADASTGRVYGKSNFPCNPMVEVCDRDYNRVVSWESESAAILAACH